MTIVSNCLVIDKLIIGYYLVIACLWQGSWLLVIFLCLFRAE